MRGFDWKRLPIIILLLVALISSGLTGIPPLETPARAAGKASTCTCCHCGGCCCTPAAAPFALQDTDKTPALTTPGCHCFVLVPGNEPLPALLPSTGRWQIRHLLTLACSISEHRSSSCGRWQQAVSVCSIPRFTTYIIPHQAQDARPPPFSHNGRGACAEYAKFIFSSYSAIRYSVTSMLC